ncbi:MAG: hypothetical protein MIO90_01395 [Methanomassiliicoccales archaeon]|nr:hypothetical protein [Methanomassiliicoccales archaeon]
MDKEKGGIKVDGFYRWITVNNVRYETDIIIHTDGTVSVRDETASLDFAGDYFHVPLSERELQFLSEERPEKVIIGSGFKAMLSLTPNAKEILREYDYVEKTTSDAIELINNEKSKFVAIMHIRC